MDSKPPVKTHHTLSVDARSKGAVSGVEEVVSYTDGQLFLKTSEGTLTIIGSDLKIVRYSTEDGSLTFSGTVNTFKYGGGKQPILKRIFK